MLEALYVLQGVMFLLVVGCLLMIIRNGQVYHYRGKMLDAASRRSRDMILRHDFAWREAYRSYERLSYDDMLYKFWLPWPSIDPSPSCRICGCTDDDCRQCVEKQEGEPCYWVEPDLCSACALEAVAH